MGFVPRLGPLLGCVLVVAAPLAAADELGVQRARAVRLAHEGRCGAALPELERVGARSAPAERAALGLLAGQCLVRLERYADAIAALDEVERLAPGLAGLDQAQVVARYHAGDLDGSARALERAARAGDEDAELTLYRGLLLLARDDAAAAAPQLERARSLDPARVEPLASYHVGLAWQTLGRRRRAREALARVRSGWPDSPWARAADRALAPTGPARSPDAWGSLSAGFEYDDNVVLRGDGVQLPAEISSERDTRITWAADLGIALARDEHWRVGTRLSYAGAAHRDLERFNAHHPSLSVWLDRRLDEQTTARLLADFSYAWVDGAPFRVAQRGTVSLSRRWRSGATSGAFARFARHDFRFSSDDVPDGAGGVGTPCPAGSVLCGPDGLDEARARNRDGNGTELGITHELRLPIARAGATGDTRLRGGLRYARFSSRGSEYSYDAYQIGAGTRTRLPFGWVLDAWADWTYRPYRHPTTFPDPDGLFANQQYGLRDVDRREHTTRTRISLERALTRRLSVSARWSYLRNRSNADVFQHERHRVGAFLTLALER